MLFLFTGAFLDPVQLGVDSTSHSWRANLRCVSSSMGKSVVISPIRIHWVGRALPVFRDPYNICSAPTCAICASVARALPRMFRMTTLLNQCSPDYCTKQRTLAYMPTEDVTYLPIQNCRPGVNFLLRMDFKPGFRCDQTPHHNSILACS